METPVAVTLYFEYLNSDQLDKLREVFSSDAYIAMGGASPREGIEAILAYYPLALAPLPKHIDDPVDIVVSESGKRVAVEIEFSGETAAGKSVVFTAVDLFDLDSDGRVKRLRSFYDTALVARLLKA